MRSVLRYPESLIVVAYFALRPIELLLWTEPSLRSVLIYGVVAPAIGALLGARHSRARFAAYMFLTMEILRCFVAGSVATGCVAVAVLVVLQLPRMRALWPRIDARRVAARLICAPRERG